jgi:NADH:ubiquinone oxidoreductase subunit 5 (subunit L)/multisubunit Na+/H+ antiporter MnhA subunit
MRLMGGLRKQMPVTFWTFVVGSVSLAGVFPLAGFWSKDEILNTAWHNEKYLFVIALVTAGLTAFYMTRAVCMTFLGEYRGGGEPEHGPTATAAQGATAEHGAHEPAQEHHASGPHESPPVMALPLLILAVPAVLFGVFNLPWKFLGLDHEIEHLLVGALPSEVELSEFKFNYGAAIASTAFALGGIALGLAIYQAQVVSASSLRRAFGPLHALLENKYYADVFYERVIVGFVFYEVICGSAAWFDTHVVDGVVNGAGKLARGVGGTVRHLQTGEYQTYGAIGFAGVVFTVILVLALHSP